MNPFDIAKNILTSRKKIDDIQSEGYNPFMVNRVISYNYDCVMQAQIMNESGHLDHDLQYRFLFDVVEKKKRGFVPYQKGITDLDVKMTQEAFGCNQKTALQYLSLLNTEGLEKLKDSLYKGGVDAKS